MADLGVLVRGCDDSSVSPPQCKHASFNANNPLSLLSVHLTCIRISSLRPWKDHLMRGGTHLLHDDVLSPACTYGLHGILE